MATNETMMTTRAARTKAVDLPEWQVQILAVLITAGLLSGIAFVLNALMSASLPG